MADQEGGLAVQVLLDGSLAVGPGEAQHAPEADVVAVAHPKVLALHDGIVELEHLLAEQLVVAVHNDKQLVTPAFLMGSPVYIGHGHSPLLVEDDLHLLL